MRGMNSGGGFSRYKGLRVQTGKKKTQGKLGKKGKSKSRKMKPDKRLLGGGGGKPGGKKKKFTKT